IIEEIENANMEILRNLSDKIKAKTKSAFVFLESTEGDKVNMILTGTKDLVSNGLNASEIIKPAAKIVNGSGGGRPDFAQAGGKDPSKLSKVFEFIEKSATDIIGGIAK
ncbi:MAG: DHHA1 domain-containing protein, partial [Candidatus Omnitrophota bacterium]